MKIVYEETKKKEIQLSDKQVKEITRKCIKKKYFKGENCYVHMRDGVVMLCYDEEVYTSHKFDIRHELRVATDKDKIILEILQELRE